MYADSDSNKYDENGGEIVGDNNIVVKRDKITRNYIRGLRKNIEEVIKICGGYVPPVEDAVEVIVKKYINRISKDTTSKTYLVSEFKSGDEKTRNVLKTPCQNTHIKYVKMM